MSYHSDKQAEIELWRTWLTNERLRNSGSSTRSPGRSAFQHDYDRIVFSEAFRTLHGKTQVVPMPRTSSVHSRLTHSMEVSCVGRSLGISAALKLREIYEELPGAAALFDPAEIGTLVATACLAHDIGNPPFGHSGEKGIGHWFQSNKKEWLQDMNVHQQADLCQFEGNAAGFRILTRNYEARSLEQYGMDLTVASLAVFLKYPQLSGDALPKGARADRKKYSFFYDDRATAQKVMETCAMPVHEGAPARHPLNLLMEAADDICYHFIDLEDGHKLGFIAHDTARDLMLACLTEELKAKAVRKIANDIRGKNEIIGYLRALGIASLTGACVEVWAARLEEVCRGSFADSLSAKCAFAGQLREIKNISHKQLYDARAVKEIEVAGYEVLYGLLEAMVPAAFCGWNGFSGRDNPRNHALRQLIDPAWLLPVGNIDDPEARYRQLLNIACCVAALTDEAALNLYRKLRGIELPAI